MDSDDLSWAEEPIDGGSGELALIDDEGVVHLPQIERGELVVIRVELLERVLTHVFSEGLRRRPVVPE
jgi:hypothetical protein